jgi:hypothetical protein
MDERNFSEERVEKTLEELRDQHGKRAQKGLGDF